MTNTTSAEVKLMPEGSIENFEGSPGAVTIGKNSYCRGRLLTYGHGGKITIGDWCYVGVRSEIWSMSEITIGDRVLISHDVNIHDGTGHSKNPEERHKHFRQIIERSHPRSIDELPGITASPIVIEDDVWINFSVIILKGVRIGKRSIIAAGSIVTSNVPPDTLYGSEVIPKMQRLKAET